MTGIDAGSAPSAPLASGSDFGVRRDDQRQHRVADDGGLAGRRLVPAAARAGAVPVLTCSRGRSGDGLLGAATSSVRISTQSVMAVLNTANAGKAVGTGWLHRKARVGAQAWLV